MDCVLIQGRLIEYQFATLEDADREAVEAHLLACKTCLRTYLALKAHVDARGERTAGTEVPTEAARMRLRAAVEARFRPTAPRRLRRWLSRPVPLYQGIAAAALLAIAAALAPGVARSLHADGAGGARPAEQVDTARPAAESLTIY